MAGSSIDTFLARATAFFRWLAAAEALPEDPPPRPGRREHRRARWLFSAEPLPLDAACGASGRTAEGTWLWSSEPLPQDEAPEDGGRRPRGLVRFVLASEALPVDPVRTCDRVTPGLAWLLGPDRLEEPTDGKC
jgi:hypothetical protein